MKPQPQAANLLPREQKQAKKKDNNHILKPQLLQAYQPQSLEPYFYGRITYGIVHLLSYLPSAVLRGEGLHKKEEKNASSQEHCVLEHLPPCTCTFSSATITITAHPSARGKIPDELVELDSVVAKARSPTSRRICRRSYSRLQVI